MRTHLFVAAMFLVLSTPSANADPFEDPGSDECPNEHVCLCAIAVTSFSLSPTFLAPQVERTAYDLQYGIAGTEDDGGNFTPIHDPGACLEFDTQLGGGKGWVGAPPRARVYMGLRNAQVWSGGNERWKTNGYTYEFVNFRMTAVPRTATSFAMAQRLVIRHNDLVLRENESAARLADSTITSLNGGYDWVWVMGRSEGRPENVVGFRFANDRWTPDQAFDVKEKGGVKAAVPVGPFSIEIP